MKNLQRMIFQFILILIFHPTFAYSIRIADENLKFKTSTEDPTAQITGTATVCLNANKPKLTFEVSNGINGPYTFSYKLSEVQQPDITTVIANAITIDVPTSTAGIFEYTLLSVLDKDNHEIALTTKTAIVTVNDLPILTGNFHTCIGSNSKLNSTETITTWTSSNPSVASIDGSGLVKGIAIGTTNISFTNSNGCQNSLIFRVHPLPVANFTSNVTAGTCSGDLIQFTSNITTGTAPYSYEWDFGDGATSTEANPIHSFTSLGCSKESFTVKLIVKDSNDCFSSIISNTISVNQKPKIEVTDLNPFSIDPFNNCSSSSGIGYLINVGISAANSPCIQPGSISIDWGDGSSVSNVVFPITHNYTQLKAYNMVVSAVGENGCSNSKTYVVKNVSNPSGGISSPGNTQNLCAPTIDLEFGISSWGLNSSDTTYEINYGDNTPIITVTQAQLENSPYYDAANPIKSANYPIPHSYMVASCPNSQVTVTLKITNACSSTPFTTSNVSILSKPNANFTAPASQCVNSSVLFTNTTTAGFSQGCSQNSIYTWDFGDGSPIITTPLQSVQNISHTYTVSGTYTVTMSVTGYCGTSTKTQQICIEKKLDPSFTLNTNSGCTPLAVLATNTTLITNSCNTTYSWKATYKSGFCGSGAILIPEQTTQNASYNFVKPGTYSITLTTTNSCGSVVSPVQTVIIKQPPTVVINNIAPICQTFPTTTFHPVATVTTCGALSYEWDFPGGTPTTSTNADPGFITYNTSGTFPFSLKVTNDCGSNTKTSSFVINEVPVLTTPLLTQTVCSNLPSNLVNLTSNLAGTTFTWTATATTGVTGFITSGTSATIPIQTIATTNSSPGTVTYAITPLKDGCPGPIANYVITVNPAPSIIHPLSSSVCIGGTPTILSVTVLNPIGIPTYQWYSNTVNTNSGGTPISGATNSTYSPLASTVGVLYYYCIITLPSSECGNFTSNTASVTSVDLPVIITQPQPNQSICVGGNSTPLTVSYSGGTGTATYQWYSNNTNTSTGGNPISGALNSTYTPAVFNTIGSFYYYVTITVSGNTCGSITSNPSEIIVVANPTVSSPLASQTVCQGAIPNELVVVAAGGIGSSFLYQWYRNSTNNTVSGIPISGANSPNYTPLTPLSGTTYYYCVISQTSLGCTAKSTTAEVIVKLAPQFTVQPQSNSLCLKEIAPALSVAFKNGTGTPTYQWFSNTTNSTIGATAIGTNDPSYTPTTVNIGTLYYFCVIALPPTSGCSNLTSEIASITVLQNPEISNKSAEICSGNSFTILPESIGGDSVPKGTTYTWKNPIINPIGSVNGVSEQITGQVNISQSLINTTTNSATVTYAVTPQSGNCIGADFNVIITVDPSISPNITSTNSSCFGANNGMIQTNISGGYPPYLVSWTSSNGFTSNAPSIYNLAPGDYNLSISDGGNCPYSTTITITQPKDLFITTDLKKDINCFGNANGSIAISVTGGTPNYTYSWTKDGIPYTDNEDLSNLEPGIYVVTVSDAENCEAKTATFTIAEPPVLRVNLVNKSTGFCFGEAIGAITVNIIGGIAPYTFDWTGSNGFTSSTQNLNALSAGTYNLKVTDNSGCFVDLAPVTITESTEINIIATTTPIICYGGNDATIQISISGGVAPYQTTWSNLGTGTFQNNLSSGNYLITVTDALNCIKTLNVVISDPPIFKINPVVKQISCFGANDGSINLNLAGGIAPILLTWSDGSTAGTTRNKLSPGTYSVTIKDSFQCIISTTFTILEPQPLTLSTTTTDALDCDNASSGSINLIVSGGTPPFNYIWSNGATTEDLINLTEGTYLVTVTDARGCTKFISNSIKRPQPITIKINTKTDFDCDSKNIKQTFEAQVAGGIPPYQLSWSNGTVSGSNNELMSTNQNGTVLLEVTDKMNCKANNSFDINIPTIGTPALTTNSYGYTNYGYYSVMEPIQFTNKTTGDYVSLIWDFGDGTISNELNPIHHYTISKNYVVKQTVTYPFGCVYVNTINLMVEKGYVLVIPTAFSPNNDGINDIYRPVTQALKNISIDIYDTWGSLIYSEFNSEVLKGWDGKIKGVLSENGNYFCKLSAETFYGTTITENTPFVLIK